MRGDWRAAGLRRRCALSLIVALLVGVLSGCGDREPEIRRYHEISSVPVSPTPSAMAPVAPASPAPPVAWITPEGWEERLGGNMRIASFVTGDGRECTLTAFPGDVGGLEANARRWLGQLGAPAPEDLPGILQTTETLSTDSGLAGQLLDFRGMVAGEGDAMLAGVIKKDHFTIFVKLIAPPQVLTAEEERFRALCRSIR